MPKKIIDLDLFLQEQEIEAGSVRFKGKEYPLPAEIPWHLMVRAQEMDGTDVSMDDIGVIVSGLVGKESWDALLTDGLGFKSGLHLMNALIEQVMETIPEGDPKATAQAKLAAASRSPSETPLPTSDSPEQTSGGVIRLGIAN